MLTNYVTYLRRIAFSLLLGAFLEPARSAAACGTFEEVLDEVGYENKH